MSLGRLGGRNHLCSRSGTGSGSQQGCGVSTQPAAPVAPLLLVEERERGDFGNYVKCCEVRHVMEGQSLPLASWKQVREWKWHLASTGVWLGYTTSCTTASRGF